MSNYIKLWIMGSLLSLSVIIAKQLISVGLHPIYLAMLQAAGSIIFLGSLGIKGLAASLQSKWLYYLLASMLGFSIPQLIVFYAVQHVGASVAALAYAFPLFITFFLSHLVSNNKLEVKPLLYMLGAFLGSVLYLYKPDVINFDNHQLNWFVLLSLAPLAISIANIYRSWAWPVSVPVYHVALLTNVFSLCSYALLAAYESPELPYFRGLTLTSLILVAIFMLIAAIGQYFLFSLQKSASPSFVGQTGSITALCGGVLSFLFFQESYQFTTLLGSLLIFLGVAGFSRQQAHKPI